jgi:hypothetical protein
MNSNYFILIWIFYFCYLQSFLSQKLSKLTLSDLEKQEKQAISSYISDGYTRLKENKELNALAEIESRRLAVLGELDYPNYKINKSVYGYSMLL